MLRPRFRWNPLRLHIIQHKCISYKTAILSEPLLPNSREWFQKQRRIKHFMRRHGNSYSEKSLEKVGLTTSDINQYYKKYPVMNSGDNLKLIQRREAKKEIEPAVKRDIYAKIAYDSLKNKAHRLPLWYICLNMQPNSTKYVNGLKMKLQKIIMKSSKDSDRLAPDNRSLYEQQIQEFTDLFNRYTGDAFTCNQCRQLILNQYITNHSPVLKRRSKGDNQFLKVLNSMENDVKESIVNDSVDSEITKVIKKAIESSVELTPLESYYWLNTTIKSGDYNLDQILTSISLHERILNMNSSHYNLLLKCYSNQYNDVLKHMAKAGVNPDRRIVSTLIGLYNEDSYKLLQLTKVIFSVLRINIDGSLAELLIDAYMKSGLNDFGMLMFAEIVKMYSSHQKLPMEIPEVDKLVLDKLLTELNPRPINDGLFRQVIKPTKAMVESITSSLKDSKPIIEYLKHMNY